MTSKAAKLKQKRISRGRPRKEGLGEPGCAVLPEDMDWVLNSSNLKAQPVRTPAPRIVSSCRVPRSDVERRIMTAMKTLRSFPDKEKRFLTMKSSSPAYVQDYMDAYNSISEYAPKFIPTPSDIDDCLVALSWVRHLEKKAWQMLWWRSFGLSFGLIAKYIGRSDETARKRYEEALIDAWCAANGV